MKKVCLTDKNHSGNFWIMRFKSHNIELLIWTRMQTCALENITVADGWKNFGSFGIYVFDRMRENI